MVAKRGRNGCGITLSLNLAKIHMVAKQKNITKIYILCLNLAKIHMVAKPSTSLLLR